MAVNQNGSRFLYLKQTLSRTSGAKSRNRYLWIRKLQKSHTIAHLVKPSEVKGAVLKKKCKAVSTEFSGRKILLRLRIELAEGFTRWK
jgi:hypothetical protein